MAGPLRPGRFELAGDVSSQFVSGLLFALPLLAGGSRICLRPPVESRSYIEMTRAAQRRFGVVSRWADPNTLDIPGGQAYRPRDLAIEGDWSQAAFPAVLGALAGDVTVGRAGARHPAGGRGHPGHPAPVWRPDRAGPRRVPLFQKQAAGASGSTWPTAPTWGRC